jgi:hypothetical protein
MNRWGRGLYVAFAGGVTLGTSGCGGGGAAVEPEGDAAQDAGPGQSTPEDAADDEMPSFVSDAAIQPDATAVTDDGAALDATGSPDSASDATSRPDGAGSVDATISPGDTGAPDAATMGPDANTAWLAEAGIEAATLEVDATLGAPDAGFDAALSALDASPVEPDDESGANVGIASYFASDGGFLGPQPGTELAALCGGGCGDGSIECQGQCVTADAGCACAPGWTSCDVVEPRGPPYPPYEPPELGPICTSLETDPFNCGACNAWCAQGQVCVDSTCVDPAALFLVTGLPNPQSIAVDATRVYWADESTGAIESMPKAGGPVTILAQGQYAPSGLTLHDGFVYWGTGSGGDGVSNSIVRVPIDGSGTAEIVITGLVSASFESEGAQFLFVFVGETIYFIGGTILTVPAGGGTSTVFFLTGSPPLPEFSFLGLATDGLALYTAFQEDGVASPFFGIIPIATPDEVANPQLTNEGEFGNGLSGMAFGGGLLDLVENGHGLALYDPATGDLAQEGTPTSNFIVPWACGLFTMRGLGLPYSDVQMAENIAFMAIGFSVPGQPYPAMVVQNFATLAATTTDFSPRFLATDGTFVYWTDASGAIGRVPIP